MYCLIAAESAIFPIFVVAYLFYIGKSVSGLSRTACSIFRSVETVCLLSSSLTIHVAVGMPAEREAPRLRRLVAFHYRPGSHLHGGHGSRMAAPDLLTKA